MTVRGSRSLESVWSSCATRRSCIVALLFTAALILPVRSVQATKLLLMDGRTLDGAFAQISGVADSPLDVQLDAGEVHVTPILVIDDGLRRSFIHKTQVRQILEHAAEEQDRVKVWQPVAEHGGVLARVGRSLSVTPFDEYGRRIYEMIRADGPIPVVQGITEITPVYTKVEGLAGGDRPITWDMRIATSSIPREALQRILTTTVPRDDLEARLQVVRLYLQCERYRDARLALEEIAQDFPDAQNFDRDLRQLRQLGARTVLKEIRLRMSAGQHGLVRSLLADFPSEEVAGETLQEVRELLRDYEKNDAERTRALELLDQTVAQIRGDQQRKAAEQFVSEITDEVGRDSQERLAGFVNLADDEGLSVEQKVAMAISGWLVGTKYATDNLNVALSLTTVRQLVRQYLRETEVVKRSQLLIDLHDLEGANVERVAQLLNLMKPPLEIPDEAQRGPGQFELTIPGLNHEADVRYLVQLPPEYDPLRKYAAIVVLNGEGYRPKREIDFWCGTAAEDGRRRGQAMRHGYVTIAVDWQQPHQISYGYSAREHYAVLGCLRDARRHFAIDTDRVFLTGHGIGGDAAWDIALAHPDEWAGVIPFCATADRYCARYWRNAEYVPWYFVNGELDGDKVVENAREFDRYLRPTFDATVVELLGRGFEPFGDELQNLFDWMNRRRRRVPQEFECATMRPWDNFFWWLELEGMSEKSMVSPTEWPLPRGTRPARVRSEVLGNERVLVNAQAEKTTVWLAPEFVDFDKQITVELFGRRITPRKQAVEPQLEVLLEDARTRADRQHPFWAKVESP